jgi:dolichol-phosphate mannosyltransferase
VDGLESVIIIPTYNEKDNIAPLINHILRLKSNFHILVVDDSSPDGTGQLVELIAEECDYVHILQRVGKLGYGAACLDGFKWALDSGAEAVFTMDADFSHNPRYLPDLYNALGSSDVAIGSRYVEEGGTTNWPSHRLLLSSFANKYIHMITKIPVADCTSGFRAYSRSTLNNLPLEAILSEGYSFLVELLFHISNRGLKTKEVPIIFEDRSSGRSKISRKIIWESIWIPWSLKLITKQKAPGRANACSCHIHAQTNS